MSVPLLWRERLLHVLLAPVNAENLRFMEAWHRAEGGTALNNPLNTTYPMPWASSYNSVGVRNYDTPLEGLAATAATFGRDRSTNNYYVGLWKDLQAGSFTAEELVKRNPNALSHWGTSPELMNKVLREV